MAYMELRKISGEERIEDDDPMVIIEKRMAEIRQMVDPRRTKTHVLDKFNPETKEIILKYKDISGHHIKKKNRKRAPKLIDRFRRAVSLVQLLLRGFRGRKRCFTDDTESNQLRKKVDIGSAPAPTVGRASIGLDLQVALTIQPHYRDRKSIKQILWILRATKAFKHLFPAEMEDEVARHVSYERYEDGRILAVQGRVPDRFYYIMSGRVNLLRQYKLSTGQVTKSMGYLTKGMTTDPQEIDMQWMREESLVAKGQVEALILDKKAFSKLQHTTDGPPVEFLQSLHLFEEFPMDRFDTCHDSIEIKYYGPRKIVVKDSNRTPWLHVVKSGCVKVVRRQSVIDVKSSNETKFSAPTVEHLGCGKAFSHADVMLGPQQKQRKLKAIRESTFLPQIQNANPFGETIGVSSHVIYRQPADDTLFEDAGEDGQDSIIYESQTPPNEKTTFVHIDTSRSSSRKSSVSSTRQSNKGLSRSVDGINDFEPHNLWLTREKTGHDSIYAKNKKPEFQHRRAYLQLDVLKPGDVFGLDHMQPALASEPRGVSLLSDGAEVVKISKRFFLQNADNNTMLKVETMYKEYLTEKEAEAALYQKETWQQYKTALWDRMTAPPAIPSASSR